MPKKENTKETKKAPAKKATSKKTVEKNTPVVGYNPEKKKSVMIFALVLIIINVFVSVVTLTSALTSSGGVVSTGGVNYDKIKNIVKQEILQNEYNNYGGKENYEIIQEIQKPQIEQAVNQYKQQQAQAAEDAKPKFLSQDEIQAVYNQGYNEGDELAKFLWLEYSEMECPYCARLATSNARDMVKEEFGEDITHSIRHFPLNFHENAIPAALVAECVGDELGSEAFYEVFDKSFNSGKSDLTSMLGFAKELGANEVTVKACVDSETYKEKIESQMQYGSSKFGITGTPGHIIINTETGEYTKVSGAVGGATLIQTIEKIK